MDNEPVPIVGGPKDGEAYRWTTARTLLIPDAKDMRLKVMADGDIVTIFGRHTYELNCYAKDGEMEWRWEYVGYVPPEVA